MYSNCRCSRTLLGGPASRLQPLTAASPHRAQTVRETASRVVFCHLEFAISMPSLKNRAALALAVSFLLTQQPL